MQKFRQSASSLEKVRESIELAKMLDRNKYRENMQRKIGAWVQLFCIGVVCLLLAILF